MAANGAAAGGGYNDTSALMLAPKFEGSSAGSGPMWQAQEVRLRFGRRPSFAKIYIPLSDELDEAAPSVACVSSSAVEGIKGGDYCTVSLSNGANGAPVLAGSVTNIARSITGDTASIRIEDHRYLLDGIVVKGSFWLSGGSIIYRQGVHPHVNKDGKPNCALVSGVPVFCPPRLGLNNDENPPDNPTETKAGYWTTKHLAQYFRWVFASGSATSLASLFDEFKQIPTVIEWPSSFATALDQEELAQKRARSMDYEGMKLGAALSEVCEQSGPYALWMKPLSANKNALQFVRTSYNGDGLKIGRAAGGAAGSTLNKVLVTSGDTETDFSETFTMVVASGDFVYIERRANTYEIGLKKAWTEAEQTAWKEVIKEPENDIPAYSTEAFRQASANYPRVFQAYTVDPDWDFQGDTSASGYPRAAWPRRVLDALLTQTLGDGMVNGADLPVNVPVRWEVSQPSSGTVWYETIADQGWSVDDDGLIWLKGFFKEEDNDASNTWNGSYVDSDAVNAIAPRYFRATLAIPCDHRITDVVKVASDPTGGVQTYNAGGDSKLFSSHLSRCFYADADRLYEYVCQKDSWPITESEGGGTEQSIDPLRDDTDELKAHTRRRIADLGTAKRSGRLVYPFLHAAWQPGYMISQMDNVGGGGSFPIQACVQEVAFNSAANTTELILG